MMRKTFTVLLALAIMAGATVATQVGSVEDASAHHQECREDRQLRTVYNPWSGIYEYQWVLTQVCYNPIHTSFWGIAGEALTGGGSLYGCLRGYAGACSVFGGTVATSAGTTVSGQWGLQQTTSSGWFSPFASYW